LTCRQVAGGEPTNRRKARFVELVGQSPCTNSSKSRPSMTALRARKDLLACRHPSTKVHCASAPTLSRSEKKTGKSACAIQYQRSFSTLALLCSVSAARNQTVGGEHPDLLGLLGRLPVRLHLLDEVGVRVELLPDRQPLLLDVALCAPRQLELIPVHAARLHGTDRNHVADASLDGCAIQGLRSRRVRLRLREQPDRQRKVESNRVRMT
jgi:hypothetical protein